MEGGIEMHKKCYGIPYVGEQARRKAWRNGLKVGGGGWGALCCAERIPHERILHTCLDPPTRSKFAQDSFVHINQKDFLAFKLSNLNFRVQ